MDPGFYQDLDDATARLAIQLQLEDSRETVAQLGGGDIVNQVEHLDANFALQLHLEEIERSASLLEDRRIATAVGRGVELDGQLAPVPTAEATASAGRPNTVNTVGFAGYHLENDLYGPDNAVSTDSMSGGDALTDPESTVTATLMEIEPTFPCTVCMDRFVVNKLVATLCGHQYCLPCLLEVFTRSFVDEGLYPPRCCRVPIDIETVGHLFTSDVIDTFHEKRIEFGTKDRTYCSQPQCSIFLKPEAIYNASTALCPACNTRTCLLCKAAAHIGDCSDDEGTKQFRELAQEQGWHACPGCKRTVELRSGCYHIICPCSTHFCYICGATPWKNCECPQWDEGMLYDRALAVAQELEPYGGRLALMVAAEQLLRQHNCEHGRFRRVAVAGDCSMCDQRMPQFVYDCVQCHFRVCRRCKQNRL